MYRKVNKGENITYLTLNNEECTLVFPQEYKIFMVKGNGFLAGLHPGLTQGDDGVYESNDNIIYINSYVCLNTIYIKGTGKCAVWAGKNSYQCPFTHSGGGTGETVTYSEDEPSVNDGKNGDVWFVSHTIGGDYIQSDGTQWIDTDISGTGVTAFEIDCAIDEYVNDRWAFGTWQSAKDTIIGTYGSKIRFALGGTSKDVNFDTDIHWYRADNTGGYIDGAKTHDTVNWSNIPALKIYLFSDNHNGSTLPAKCKIYRAKIWQNNVLVRDMIPYIDGSDVVCMYDKVSNTAFYNSGTGTFVKGTSTSTTSIAKCYIKRNGSWVLVL